MIGFHKERFIKLLEFLKTLNNDQFDYSQFVAIYDHKQQCGTVCCAAGWLPKVFPQEWELAFDGVRWIPAMPNFGPDQEIEDTLAHFFGMTSIEVNALFYGDYYAQDELNLPITDDDSELPAVINLFEHFLKIHYHV